jgi:hypothetical protein
VHSFEQAIAVAEAAVEAAYRGIRKFYDGINSKGVIPALCENGLGSVKHFGHRTNAAVLLGFAVLLLRNTSLLRFTAHVYPNKLF